MQSKSRILFWAFLYGAVGFGCGFFGPIALNPDANQGPLMGIFLTGPGGFVLGLLLAALVSGRAFDAVRERVLFGVLAVGAITILVACLPGPEWRGDVLDAEVSRCEEPGRKLDESIAEWEERIARVTWAKPPATWRSDAVALLERERGVVLTLAVVRTSRIEEDRKPWNRGRLRARAWEEAGDTREFWGRDASCEAWLARGRALWFPQSEMSRSWPPDRLANFLGLQELRPAPDSHRALLDRG